MTAKTAKLARANRIALAQLIIAAYKEAGYSSRYEFAKAAGVNNSTLGSIERGEVSPSIETLDRMFGAIGWEVVVTFRARGEKS